MLADNLLGSWPVEAAARLLAAAVLGAVIGLEREHHGRAAGLRTHLLVALGAAMAMIVSLHFPNVFGAGQGGQAVTVDPARVAYGVMAGIGFLGAGTIIRYGTGIRGLTTAASLWCAAAIGLGTGFGMYLIAGVATAIVLFALVVLDFADRIIHGRVSKTVSVTVPDTSGDCVERIEKLLHEAGAHVVNVNYTSDFESNVSVITLSLTVPAPKLQAALDHLRQGAPEIKRMAVE